MDRQRHISMMACAAACVVACTDTAHGAVTTVVDLDMTDSRLFSHRDNTVSGVSGVRNSFSTTNDNQILVSRHDYHDFSSKTTTVSEHEYEGASWNPGTDGAIHSISFSIDAMAYHFRNGTSPDMFFDGISFFVTDGTNTAYSESFTLPNSEWNTLSTGALTSSELAGIDFTGTNDLTFGFRVQTTSLGTAPSTSLTTDTFIMRFENFSVSIDYTASVAPTPGSIAIMGLSGCLYFRRSRS